MSKPAATTATDLTNEIRARHGISARIDTEIGHGEIIHFGVVTSELGAEVVDSRSFPVRKAADAAAYKIELTALVNDRATELVIFLAANHEGALALADSTPATAGEEAERRLFSDEPACCIDCGAVHHEAGFRCAACAGRVSAPAADIADLLAGQDLYIGLAEYARRFDAAMADEDRAARRAALTSLYAYDVEARHHREGLDVATSDRIIGRLILAGQCHGCGAQRRLCVECGYATLCPACGIDACGQCAAIAENEARQAAEQALAPAVAAESLVVAEVPALGYLEGGCAACDGTCLVHGPDGDVYDCSACGAPPEAGGQCNPLPVEARYICPACGQEDCSCGALDEELIRAKTTTNTPPDTDGDKLRALLKAETALVLAAIDAPLKSEAEAAAMWAASMVQMWIECRRMFRDMPQLGDLAAHVRAPGWQDRELNSWGIQVQIASARPAEPEWLPFQERAAA